MRSLLPARLTRRAAARDATIIAIDTIDTVGDGPLYATGRIVARRAGRERPTGTLQLPGPRPAEVPERSPTVELRLPEDMVLMRDVVLPLAAERDLPTVLGYEMNRLTPFEADEVFWGVSQLRRDPARGLRLTLMVVLRVPLERLVEALDRIGLKPSALETRAGRIELAGPGAGAITRNLLWGLCGLLALLCLAVPVLRQQAALGQAARQIAALAPARQEAVALRHRLAVAASSRTAVAAAQHGGDPQQILAALTAAVPNGTSLTDLTLKAGVLTIEGKSNDAAGLIAKLAASHPFVNPGFVAPITRSIDGQTELFSIQAGVSP